MSLWVSNSVVSKDNFVWNDANTCVAHLIGNTCWLYIYVSMHLHVTFKIDGTKGSDDFTPAVSLHLNLVHERATEAL